MSGRVYAGYKYTDVVTSSAWTAGQISLSSYLNISPEYISSYSHDFELVLKQQSFFEEMWEAN